MGSFTSSTLPLVKGDDDDALQTKWFLLDELPPLAFDHQNILDDLKDAFLLQ